MAAFNTYVTEVVAEADRGAYYLYVMNKRVDASIFFYVACMDSIFEYVAEILPICDKIDRIIKIYEFSLRCP